KALTGGGPDGSTEVFLSYMYKEAYTNSSYGYGMAIGVVVFLFSFGLSAILNRVTEREVYEF
ncbi:MAG: sugar ABC transporter permease, partial [Angelakisella sp.]